MFCLRTLYVMFALLFQNIVMRGGSFGVFAITGSFAKVRDPVFGF